jgi:glycosyltransferase involved in cell wall biosynthesis
MIRLAHVITGLGTGGAETMLYRLIPRLDRTRFEQTVISLSGTGAFGEKVADLGVPVKALGLQPSRPDPTKIVQLVHHVRRLAPDIVQTWMYHADLLGGLAGRLAGSRVIWGVYCEPAVVTGAVRRLILKSCATLSRSVPARVVFCSERSRRAHEALGYDPTKSVFIPNGFELDTFHPDPEARAALRRELGLSEDAVLIGMAGRFNPAKDHPNFFAAAGRLSARRKDARFVLWGVGISPANGDLTKLIAQAGVGDRVHLLSERDDVPRLTAALDIATSASYTEAFALVVGEAMSCGVPCVVTDVGDSALIVGDTGRVVPPRDPEALATAWAELLEVGAAGRARLGAAARRWVEEKFSVERVGCLYAELYERLAAPA